MKLRISFLVFCFCSIPPLFGCASMGSGPQEVAYDGYTGRKSIAVFLDGTSDDWQTRTNVRRLFEIVASQDRHDIAAYYDKGVGADMRKVTGNLLGAGFAQNVREAYAFIAKQYAQHGEKGDKIYLFGFSRGAAEVRSVSGMIKLIGLPDKEAMESEKEEQGIPVNITADKSILADREGRLSIVDQAYQIYIQSREPDFGQRLADFKSRLKKGRIHENVPIKAVGVWDTVESLGEPHLDPEKRMKLARQHRIELHDNIENAFQALSLDEERTAFRPVLWSSIPKTSGRKLEQAWFPGVHSDIGGGYENKDLAGVTMNWMLEKLESTTEFDLLPEGARNGQFRVYEEPLGELHDSYTPIYQVSARQPRGSLCTNGSTLHESVYKRIEGLKSSAAPYIPAQYLHNGGIEKNDVSPELLKCMDIIAERLGKTTREAHR